MIPKFRVAFKNKIFGEVGSIDFIDKTVTIPVYDKLDGEYLGDNVYELNQAVLMQSTGLFDDSTPKKEIFEGDIVETIYNGELFTGVIVYDQEETGFKATNGRNEYGNNFCYLGGNDSIMVIGNIYQNPELLKEVGNDTDV